MVAWEESHGSECVGEGALCVYGHGTFFPSK